MSKINCDVCGTAYPETASQCPICGCVRATDAAQAEDSTNRDGSYTYVKGGRFSKANVRKRNQGKPVQDIPVDRDEGPEEPQEDAVKADRGLVIAVCLLLLAIIAVVIYIITRFFAPASLDEGGNGTIKPPESTEPSTVITQPIETTEETILPTLEETVPPTEETTVETTEPETEPTQNNNYYVKPYKTNQEKQGNDATTYVGVSFPLTLTDATGEVMDVEWQVEDPSICSVEGNTVKALKRGVTTVYVVIDGETYSCIVRVK